MSRSGYTNVVSVTPTLDTNAYASGDRLGSLHTIPYASRQTDGYGGAVLQSIFIIDSAKQSAAMDILFFSSSPTITSADNAAIDISDAEMAAKCIGAVSIDASYIALAGNSVVWQRNLGGVLEVPADSTTIYALPIIRASGTYAASSLVFQYGFLQD